MSAKFKPLTEEILNLERLSKKLDSQQMPIAPLTPNMQETVMYWKSMWPLKYRGHRAE